jgi:hypothetical protein
LVAGTYLAQAFTLEELKPGILRKFEAFARASALCEADKARSAREYARRRRSE